MNVEIHLVQNFSPSCLNRDDTNTPKSCLFGGYRRARVSSQCLKRAVRLYMQKELAIPTGWRTRRLSHEIAARLAPELNEEEATLRKFTRAALAASGFAADEKDKDQRTQVGLYLSQSEIAALAEGVRSDWAARDATAEPGPARKGARAKKDGDAPPCPNLAQAVRAVKSQVDAADIALFGRMVAEATNMNVDAAAQVAHALSTHACEAELDYFTAVDDLQPGEDPGAGMLGLVGFQSACFYRYALIQRDQLVQNLQGDVALANRTIRAFVQASVEAIPTARQNSSAAHNWPDYVAIRVGARLPLNLANAFERPVRPRGRDESLVERSVQTLESYRQRLEQMYGSGEVTYFRASTVDGMSDGNLIELLNQLDRALGVGAA